MATSSTHKGWLNDRANSRLAAVYNSTEVFDFDANDMAIAVALTTALGQTATTGNITATAGDVRVTAGNVRLGAVSAFATTEPTSAIVFKSGTEFAGAIATSGGLMSSDTVVRKVIAAGTVSNVET
jgi:hypothetical protein